MEPFLLLQLAVAPAHGYALARQVAELGFRRAAEDPSVLYKVLRELEQDGILSSERKVGEEGPVRRVYRLTPAGETYLNERAADLERQAQRVAAFLDRYRQLFRDQSLLGSDVGANEEAPRTGLRQATAAHRRGRQ